MRLPSKPRTPETGPTWTVLLSLASLVFSALALVSVLLRAQHDALELPVPEQLTQE